MGKPTVGIGHLVVPSDHVKVGDRIDDNQVTSLFEKAQRPRAAGGAFTGVGGRHHGHELHTVLSFRQFSARHRVDCEVPTDLEDDSRR